MNEVRLEDARGYWTTGDRAARLSLSAAPARRLAEADARRGVTTTKQMVLTVMFVVPGPVVDEYVSRAEDGIPARAAVEQAIRAAVEVEWPAITGEPTQQSIST